MAAVRLLENVMVARITDMEINVAMSAQATVSVGRIQGAMHAIMDGMELIVC